MTDGVVNWLSQFNLEENMVLKEHKLAKKCKTQWACWFTAKICEITQIMLKFSTRGIKNYWKNENTN